MGVAIIIGADASHRARSPRIGAGCAAVAITGGRTPFRPVAGRRPHTGCLHRYIIPSARGSPSDSAGQYVTKIRNTSIVSSHGHTAIVSSVMPILVMPDAT